MNMLNWNKRAEKYFTIRTSQIKAATRQTKNIVTNKTLKFTTKFQVLKCYVNPLLLYNCGHEPSLTKGSMN